MVEAKQITNNSLLIYLARLSDFILGIITMGLVARYLSVQGFGQYMLIMTIGWIFNTLVNIGVEQIILREIARTKDKASDFLGTGLFINVLMFILWITIFSLNLWQVRLEQIIIIAMYLNFLSEGMKALMRTTISVFLAFEKMGYDTFLTSLSRLLIFILMVVVVYFKLEFIHLFAAGVVGNGAGLLTAFLMCRKRFATKGIKTTKEELRYILKECFPVGAMLISQALYFYINVFALRVLADDRGVALFQGPNKIVTVLQVIPVAFLTAFAPILSQLGVSDTDRPMLNYIYQKSFKFLFIISFPMSVLGVLLADRIILLVFGDGFTGAVISFHILFWAINFLYLDTLFTFILISIGKQNFLIVSNTLCILTNLLLSLILIPSYGYVGAAWASLISYGMLFICDFFFVTKRLKVFPDRNSVLNPIIGSLIMGLALYKFLYLNPVFLVLGGLSVYLVSIFGLSTFSPDEKEIARKILSRT